MIKGENLKKELTKREAEVYNGLLKFIKDNHYPPALRELGDILGISKQRVSDHFKSLDEKNWVRREGNLVRSTVPREYGKKPINDIEFYCVNS